MWRVYRPSSSTAEIQYLLKPRHSGSSMLLAAWLLDEAPGEHTVGKTRDGVGQGLPIFIISLRKLSLLNYLHALFDKNWNFKIEKRRWERGKEDQGGGTEHLRDGTEKQRQTGSRKRDIIETDGERGICCVEG